MRWTRPAALTPLLGALALTAVSCYEPAMRESVLLAFLPGDAVRVDVGTRFRRGPDLPEKDREEIRRAVDFYALGRDPWLRGFERAGAVEIAHEMEGPAASPERIRRHAVLPSAASLVAAMPDAVANISLETDEQRGLRTLRIVPIDAPAPIRDNRRRLEREVESLADAVHRLGERQCDLYDYLAARPDRRAAVLRALAAPGRIDDVIDPVETARVERLAQGAEALGVWTGGEDREAGEEPALARLSFGGKDAWCLERLLAGDIADRAAPEADPPLSLFDQGLPADEAGLEGLPFSCRRDDVRDVAARIWEEILPRPYYELRWAAPGAATPAASAPPRPGS